MCGSLVLTGEGTGLGKAGKLATWTIGLVLINQLTYLVITRFATQANLNAIADGVAAAGLTTYQKAHLVFMLPHSVITVSVITALLPALSRVAHSGKLTQVSRDLTGAMKLVSFLIIPVTAVLLVVGTSVAVLLFDFGAATTDQARILGGVISIFMLGMLPFTLFYVLLRGFYALEGHSNPVPHHGRVLTRLPRSADSTLWNPLWGWGPNCLHSIVLQLFLLGRFRHRMDRASPKTRWTLLEVNTFFNRPNGRCWCFDRARNAFHSGKTQRVFLRRRFTRELFGQSYPAHRTYSDCNHWSSQLSAVFLALSRP